MLDAGAGKHNDAMWSLDLAKYNVNTSLHDTRPIKAWYQLVEACELRFEDTGDTKYRDKAVELSPIRQQMNPFESWAYAMEAKYAKTEEEWLRPLAIALYLDSRSYHMSTIPEQEKKKARKWLETNNPFRVSKPLPKMQAGTATGHMIAGNL